MNLLTDLVARLAGLVPDALALSLYRAPRAATALRRLLNAWAPEGPREVRIARGPLKGVRMVLDLRAEKYLWLGTYEPWVLGAVVEHLHTGAAAWDIGAYIGYHTLLMRRIAGPGRVLALEPEESSRRRLELHLQLNGFSDVAVLPVAAGRTSGSGRIEYVTQQASQALVVNSQSGSCPIVTLDDLLERFDAPRLIKVDVEGGEEDVILGARRLLWEVRPVWVVELHGSSDASIENMFRQSGYRVQRIGKGVDVRDDLPVGGPRHIRALP